MTYDPATPRLDSKQASHRGTYISVRVRVLVCGGGLKIEKELWKRKKSKGGGAGEPEWRMEEEIWRWDYGRGAEGDQEDKRGERERQ